MGFQRLTNAKGGVVETSPHLYVANCGPTVGLSYDAIVSVFAAYGEIEGVCAADGSGTRVIVSYHDTSSSQAAMKALNGRPCSALGGRLLHIQYSVQSLGKLSRSTKLSQFQYQHQLLTWTFLDFTWCMTLSLIRKSKNCLQQWMIGRGNILPKEEFNIMDMHFAMMNVNTSQYLGELPSFLSSVLQRIKSFQPFDHAADTNILLDQLTVNEYAPGVGLSPHIDTHSAFEGLIFSLSLAGPCIMEFRKYATGIWQEKPISGPEEEKQMPEKNANFTRKAIFLPPRSMLLLSGEARYAWHHYIPHHKVDKVENNLIRRGSRRVSFTLRKVRRGPCQCDFPQYCDSQR